MFPLAHARASRPRTVEWMRAFDQDTYAAFAELLAQPDPSDLPSRTSIKLQIGEPQRKREVPVDVRLRRDDDMRTVIDGGNGPEGCLQ